MQTITNKLLSLRVTISNDIRNRLGYNYGISLQTCNDCALHSMNTDFLLVILYVYRLCQNNAMHKYLNPYSEEYM